MAVLRLDAAVLILDHQLSAFALGLSPGSADGLGLAIEELRGTLGAVLLGRPSALRDAVQRLPAAGLTTLGAPLHVGSEDLPKAGVRGAGSRSGAARRVTHESVGASDRLGTAATLVQQRRRSPLSEARTPPTSFGVRVPRRASFRSAGDSCVTGRVNLGAPLWANRSRDHRRCRAGRSGALHRRGPGTSTP